MADREEPRRVDDPFDDRDLSIEGAGFHDMELCKRAFYAAGRRRNMFRSDAEVAKWRRIDVAYWKKQIPIEWINDRFKIAEIYRMGLPQLMSAILNVGKMEEWVRKNLHTGTQEDAEAGEEPEWAEGSNE